MDDIFVGRLMSSPVRTVTADRTLQQAGRQLIEREIGSLIIVDADDRLAGIITATDFVRLAAEGADATSTPVGDYMTADVVTTTANHDISEVAELMIENRIHHVPVVDDDDGVIGIITTTDFTAYLSHDRIDPRD